MRILLSARLRFAEGNLEVEPQRKIDFPKDKITFKEGTTTQTSSQNRICDTLTLFEIPPCPSFLDALWFLRKTMKYALFLCGKWLMVINY